jgi:hypothetical protein
LRTAERGDLRQTRGQRERGGRRCLQEEVAHAAGQGPGQQVACDRHAHAAAGGEVSEEPRVVEAGLARRARGQEDAVQEARHRILHQQMVDQRLQAAVATLALRLPVGDRSHPRAGDQAAERAGEVAGQQVRGPHLEDRHEGGDAAARVEVGEQPAEEVVEVRCRLAGRGAHLREGGLGRGELVSPTLALLAAPFLADFRDLPLPVAAGTRGDGTLGKRATAREMACHPLVSSDRDARPAGDFRSDDGTHRSVTERRDRPRKTGPVSYSNVSGDSLG